MTETPDTPVVVAEFFGPTARMEATVAESKLQGAGIKAHLGDEAVTEMGIDTYEFGTVRLVVAAADAERARELLEPAGG